MKLLGKADNVFGFIWLWLQQIAVAFIPWCVVNFCYYVFQRGVFLVKTVIKCDGIKAKPKIANMRQHSDGALVLRGSFFVNKFLHALF